MAPHNNNRNKIHSLNDPIQYDNKDTKGLPTIGHIPKLILSNEAESILKRIQNEFSEIAYRRGYTIHSLTELCCCDDGKHHLPNRRKSKYRKMSDNILGYNYGRREIHLRLRMPRTHTLYPYEDIARTMCHELAHCEVSPHNDKFFQLMEEIERQHAEYLVKGMVLDTHGFPMGAAHQTHRLGGGSTRRGKKKDTAIRAQAAEARAHKRKQQHGSYVLGGDKLTKKKGCENVEPKQAAYLAAQRRLREATQCLTHAEIIDLIHDSDEEDDDDDDDVTAISPPNPSTIKNEENEENDDDCIIISVTKPSKNQTQTQIKNHWNCSQCTYRNTNQNSLSCDICSAPKQSSKETIQSLQMEDHALAELEESKRTFGGFNIYGTSSQGSRTMNHLT